MRSIAKLKSYMPAALLAASVAIPAMAVSTTANAADLLVDPPVVEAPEVVSKGGWYLRGDISYDYRSMDNPHYSVGGLGGEVDFTSSSLDDGFSFGFGIGHQINEHFRVDVTGNYSFSAAFNGSTAGTCPDPTPADGLPGAPCTSVDTTEYSAFKLMANAYIDLGHFNGFTPYVGVGIGGAHVSWDSLTNASTCVTGDPLVVSACPGVAEGYTVTATGSTRTDVHQGVESWRFAWALHAGTSYEIAKNTKLDFGYTYTKIEGGDMFDWLDGSGTQGYDKGIEEHTFRAGIRYQIW